MQVFYYIVRGTHLYHLLKLLVDQPILAAYCLSFVMKMKNSRWGHGEKHLLWDGELVGVLGTNTGVFTVSFSCLVLPVGAFFESCSAPVPLSRILLESKTSLFFWFIFWQISSCSFSRSGGENFRPQVRQFDEWMELEVERGGLDAMRGRGPLRLGGVRGCCSEPDVTRTFCKEHASRIKSQKVPKDWQCQTRILP